MSPNLTQFFAEELAQGNTTLPDAFVTGDRNGILTLSIAGRSAASAFNPIREAEQLVSSIFEVPPSACVFFGTGLGHLIEKALEALIAADNPAPIFVFEPCPSWVQQLFEHRPSAQFWESPRISWFGPSSMERLLGALQSAHPASIAFYGNQAWAKYFEPSFEELKAKVEACRFRRQVNVNTLQKFSQLWVRNLLRNLDDFTINPGIQLTHGRFAGLPGLLLAGGPSLDTLVPQFHVLKERFVTVAVDTSLRACLRAGFQPDFVVAVDPQYWNSRHLDFIGSYQGFMVAEPSIHPRAIRPHRSRVLFASSLFPLGAHLESATGSKGRLGAGGSVATSAWDFLRQCGSPVIWSGGLDLSYPGGQTHYQGSFFEDSLHGGSGRCNPASLGMHRYLHDAKTKLWPAVDGSMVLSDERMDLYVHWFEQQAASNPQVINKRFQAAHRCMAGFEPAQLEEAMALAPIRSIIDDQLSDLRRDLDLGKIQAAHSGYPGRVGILIENLVRSVRRVAALAREAVALCSSKDAGKRRMQERLNAIDAAVLASPDTRMLGFLMEDAIQEVHGMAAPRTLAEATERSGILYGRISKAAVFYLELFETMPALFQPHQ